MILSEYGFIAVSVSLRILLIQPFVQGDKYLVERGILRLPLNPVQNHSSQGFDVSRFLVYSRQMADCVDPIRVQFKTFCQDLHTLIRSTTGVERDSEIVQYSWLCGANRTKLFQIRQRIL